MYNSNLISRGRLAGTNALRRIGAAARQARPPKTGPDDTARGAARVKELRRAMADAHPDRSGTVEQFIEARRRHQTALVSARR